MPQRAPTSDKPATKVERSMHPIEKKLLNALASQSPTMLERLLTAHTEDINQAKPPILHKAVEMGNTEMVRTIITSPIHLDVLNVHQRIDQRSTLQGNALARAIDKQDVALSLLLLERGLAFDAAFAKYPKIPASTSLPISLEEHLLTQIQLYLASKQFVLELGGGLAQSHRPHLAKLGLEILEWIITLKPKDLKKLDTQVLYPSYPKIRDMLMAKDPNAEWKLGFLTNLAHGYLRTRVGQNVSHLLNKQ